MRLTILRELPDNQALRGDWNRLVFAMTRPEVFYTFEWALAVQRTYYASIKPLFILAHEGESLAGAVALATDLAEREVSFLGAATADYCDFLSDADCRWGFLDGVLRELRKLPIKKIVLANMPADSATPAAIRRAGPDNQYYLFERPGYDCARVLLGCSEERARVRENLQRKKILRYLHSLNQQAPVQVDHLKTWQQLHPELNRFSNAHVARFLSTGRISNLARPDRRRFLEELARLLSDSGWLTLTRLTAGHVPVAWNYGFQFADSWFWYQPTFDSRFEKYSPGLCLLAKIIEEACDTPGLNLVDLGLGAEGYKERFTTGTRKTLHFTLSSSWNRQVLQVARPRTAQLVKALPSVERSFRVLLRCFATAREFFGKSGFVGLSDLVLRHVWKSWIGSREVLFYRWPSTCLGNRSHTPSSMTINPINWELLAAGVMQYADDSRTLDYLLRAAGSFSRDDLQGFALVNGAGIPLHFCWAAPFDCFYMPQLKLKIGSPSPESVLLFDCWTPDSVRGQGFYATALHLLAARLLREGKSPWIFASTTNTSSVRGIEKSGFQRRYSVSRYNRFLWRKVEIREIAEMPLPAIKAAIGALIKRP